ncbi:MAG: aminotransferase class V-fold PLP-dependent enzyme [Verrucomicrobiota bacterium]
MARLRPAGQRSPGGPPYPVPVIRLHDASFASVVDARTRAVVVSSVQWCNGYRVDLEALGKLCRECGALLVVDAIQDLGALELVVRRAEIDLLVAGGHRWLNSPFGCGLLYVRRETLPALDPASWGYLGLPEPDGGWPRYFSTPSITPFRPCVLPDTAKSFEINGTANDPGAAALGASLALVNAIGIDAVEAQVLGLARTLYEELEPPASVSSRVRRTLPARGSRPSSSPGTGRERDLPRSAARRAHLRLAPLHVRSRRDPGLDALVQRRVGPRDAARRGQAPHRAPAVSPPAERVEAQRPRHLHDRATDIRERTKREVNRASARRLRAPRSRRSRLMVEGGVADGITSGVSRSSGEHVASGFSANGR